jgi:hypothetical protein
MHDFLDGVYSTSRIGLGKIMSEHRSGSKTTAGEEL